MDIENFKASLWHAKTYMQARRNLKDYLRDKSALEHGYLTVRGHRRGKTVSAAATLFGFAMGQQLMPQEKRDLKTSLVNAARIFDAKYAVKHPEKAVNMSKYKALLSSGTSRKQASATKVNKNSFQKSTTQGKAPNKKMGQQKNADFKKSLAASKNQKQGTHSATKSKNKGQGQSR